MVDCNQKYPIQNVHRLGFLKNFITNPNIQVGDFTYYDDPDGVDNFENKNVLYHFDFVGDELIIGKFCQIATGIKFIMNGANHGLQGFTKISEDAEGNTIWEFKITEDYEKKQSVIKVNR